ncbi:hypothetical protein [Oceaniglobus indicus]|uniref:hypothetical protein n=1 Tax=Oceaniglobus indicus TaxID=2047749 RepID=UPI000C1A7FDC|nr:hypothetical protein [Oceaniglobus indicus]
MTYLQSALAGCLIAFLASPALADQPDWLPEGIVLPEGHDMQSNHSIGSSTHMLKTEVDQDPSDLLQVWADDLASNGFQVDTAAMDTGRVLFSGPGGLQGQIVVSSTINADSYTIEIDSSGG